MIIILSLAASAQYAGLQILSKQEVYSMNKNRMLVDMHLHTTASDGSFSPSEVVQRVKSSGVKVFSLTDHDTTAGVHEV